MNKCLNCDHARHVNRICGQFIALGTNGREHCGCEADKESDKMIETVETTPKTFLFIGGTFDGEIFTLPAPVSEYSLTVAENLAVEPVGSALAASPIRPRVENYHRENIIAGCADYWFYRHESLSPKEAISQLFNGYVAKGKKR